MSSGLLLALDLSSSYTGYALFDIKTKGLLKFDGIKGKTFKDEVRARASLHKVEYMACGVAEIVHVYNPTTIVVEEIAGAANRLSQKILDIQHGFLWKALEPDLPKLTYMDVTGGDGWRNKLGIRLTDADKINNKTNKKLNTQIARGTRKLPIVGPKHLAARYANQAYKLNLDPETDVYDGDKADAICLGHAFLWYDKEKVLG